MNTHDSELIPNFVQQQRKRLEQLRAQYLHGTNQADMTVVVACESAHIMVSTHRTGTSDKTIAVALSRARVSS